MAKRKRPTTRRPTKPATPKKSATPKKRPASKRRVQPSDDDVFIPKRRSGVAPYVQPPTVDDDDDDTTVFIAKRGRPVEVQSDWTDADAADAGGVSDAEFFESLDLAGGAFGLPSRAGTPAGWTPALLERHGLLARNVFGRERIVCRHGCDGTTSNVVGVSHHHYTCPYWEREGKTQAPF